MVTKNKIETTQITETTLAHVVQRLKALKGAKWADEQRSALQTLARVAGQPLDVVPANRRDVVPANRRDVVDLLNRCRPARHGVRQPRWRNVRSLVLKAIADVHETLNWRLTPLLAAWQELLAPVPEKPCRVVLVPFARFCSTKGVEPGHVRQATFEDYEQHLQRRSVRASPRAVFLGVCRAWNRALGECPHWPNVKPVVDSRRDWYALAWSALPSSLKEDTRAFLAASADPDPLSPRPVRPLRGHLFWGGSATFAHSPLLSCAEGATPRP